MSTAAQRPPVKVNRVVNWFEPVTDEIGSVGCMEFTITTPATERRPEPQKETTFYLVTRIAADFGEGFLVERVGFQPDGTPVPVEERSYHVNLNAGQSTCECKGNTFHAHCKHVEALTALRQAGKLPPIKARSTGQLAANDPEAYERLQEEWGDDRERCGQWSPDDPPSRPVVRLEDIIDEYV